MSTPAAPTAHQVAGRRERPGMVVSPFARLARAHVFLVGGDTLVALALAGSLFFSIDPDAARWRVGLYLALTMAPFAVVAPLIGPALDRAASGRRWMIIASGGVRVVVALLMARHLDSLLLFPEAFTMLVLGKGYHVAKSATLPALVRSDDELVEANSKLSLLSGIAGAVAVVPGALLSWLGGATWTCLLAAVVFACGTFLGAKLPPVAVAAEPELESEKAELRGGGILLAASAMGLLRGIVGFLTFLIAFVLRGEIDRPFVSGVGAGLGSATRDLLGFEVTATSTGSPTWHFGVAAGLAGLGVPLGALLAPRLRRSLPEEAILVSALVLTLASGLFAAVTGALVGAAAVALAVSVAASTGKLAFDSIVQRDAPDANRGRSFARFETRFQIVWVIGAAIAVTFPIPDSLGYAGLAAVAAFAAVSYVLGQRFLRTHGKLPPRRTPDVTGKLRAGAVKGAERVRASAGRRVARAGHRGGPGAAEPPGGAPGGPGGAG